MTFDSEIPCTTGPDYESYVAQLAGPLISSDTPFEKDDKCWYVVAHHPQGLYCEQIAELMGYSKQRISQIEREALEKLKKFNPGTLRAILREYK